MAQACQRLKTVVSALSIHHLEGDEKRQLMAMVHGLLTPGGVFVNADQVAGASPWVQELQEQSWLRQVHLAGTTLNQMAQARQRMDYDRSAPLGAQMAWLCEAGFKDVDCFYRYYISLVMIAYKI